MQWNYVQFLPRTATYVYDDHNFLHLQITGSTPLMLAIEYGRVKVAEKLLSCNVNLHATNKVKNFIHVNIVTLTSCTQIYKLKL